MGLILLEALLALAGKIQAAGATLYLEIVSLDEASERRSAEAEARRAAAEAHMDTLLKEIGYGA